MLFRHLIAVSLLVPLFVIPAQTSIAFPSNTIALTPSQSTVTKNLADKQRERKEYAEAIVNYTKAIKLEPKFAEAYYGRGLTYFLLKQNKEALADFDRAIQLKPKLAEAYSSRADIYQDTNLSQAINDAKQVVALKPQDAGAYTSLAIYYQKNGDYKNTIATLEQGLRQVKAEDQDALRYFKLLYRMGANDNVNAAQDARELIQSPSSPVGLKSFGIYMLAATGNSAEATKEADLMIAKYPKNAVPQWLRGFVTAFSSRNSKEDLVTRFMKAAPYFEKAILADPRSDIGYSARQIVRQLSENYPGALADAKSALKNSPRKPVLYSNRAVASWLMGDFQAAIKDLNKAIALQKKVLANKPDDQDEILLNKRFYFFRGASYEKLGNYQQSLADYNVAMMEDGAKNDPTFLSVGLIAKSGTPQKLPQMIVYHYASLSQEINLDSILVSRGRVKLSLGDKSGGMADLDRAIKISGSVGAYYQRGMARRDAGDKPGAIADLQVALAKAQESSFPKKIQIVQAELTKLGVSS
jgi:tetratricopeptide (TPR) repeat protein